MELLYQLSVATIQCIRARSLNCIFLSYYNFKFVVLVANIDYNIITVGIS